ncbi:MAG: hypothetical protein LIO97_03375, partial [Tannerellaceae bacterium]|nr:hypothetical protein [Tannerellaceae bacterium]
MYNTLDKVTIESDKAEVIELLEEMLQKGNYGVALLPNKNYQNKNIHTFIRELREKYMGGIIEVNLSKGKPVQLLPFYLSMESNKFEIYKKQNFSPEATILKNLSEICIHLNYTTNVAMLIPFLHS